MEQGERQNVYKTYDKIAGWFAENRYNGLMEQPRLDDMIAHLPAGASILDLGCGTGKPILEYLQTKGFEVTGLDASEEMLKIARANFPQTEFVLQDMRNLNLGRQFDALIAWHSFFHLPEEDQPGMFPLFAQHLKPDGLLLFTSGPARGEAWGENGGESLFHASLNPEEYAELLHQKHFNILRYALKDTASGTDTVWMAQLLP